MTTPRSGSRRVRNATAAAWRRRRARFWRTAAKHDAAREEDRRRASALSCTSDSRASASRRRSWRSSTRASTKCAQRARAEFVEFDDHDRSRHECRLGDDGRRSPSRASIAWLDSLEPRSALAERHHSLRDQARHRRARSRETKASIARGFDALVVERFRRSRPSFRSSAPRSMLRRSMSTAERRGRPAGFADTQIAGIAVSRGAAIATRNVRHFDDLPVEMINPWDAPA